MMKLKMSVFFAIMLVSSCVGPSIADGNKDLNVGLAEFVSEPGKLSFKLEISNVSKKPVCLDGYFADTDDPRIGIVQYLYREDGRNLRFDQLSGPVVKLLSSKNFEMKEGASPLQSSGVLVMKSQTKWTNGTLIPVLGKPDHEGMTPFSGEKFDFRDLVYLELEVFLRDCTAKSTTSSPAKIIKVRSPKFLMRMP